MNDPTCWLSTLAHQDLQQKHMLNFPQIIALGFIAHPGAYLRSPWNQLDFVVVITSIISTASPTNHVAILKALRLLRVLRPLRMISKLKVLILTPLCHQLCCCRYRSNMVQVTQGMLAHIWHANCVYVRQSI